MIKDISTGSGPSSPANLTYGSGEIFFSATNGTNGNELWKSDGTLPGTVMIKDIKPGSGGSFLSGNQGQFTFLDGILFFRADDGISGHELWRSDGSEAGTYLVKDINPGPTGSNPNQFIKLSSTYYFFANNGTNGFELWKTDGTGAGTSLVIDINPGTGSSINSLMTLYNGELYFFATNGTSGIEFWKTNGTAVGTVLVKDINPGTNGSYPPTGTKITIHNGKLYFHADDGVNGAELWVSDGTPGGTQMLNDINSGSAGSDPNTASFLSIGTNLYFIANTSTHGTELWLTDGTTGGTQLVKDIKPGTSSSGPGTFIEFQGALYFTADDGINGRELWKSDGTAGGTFLITQI
jgi:ELWxxDGT repeat protein